MKNLAVLGATGSIGKSTLNLVRNDPERFNVFSLMAHSNVADMKSLVHEFSPNVVVMNESSAADTVINYEDEVSHSIVHSQLVAAAPPVIPMISFASTAPSLSDESYYPYFSRSVGSDTFQADAIAGVSAF